MLNSRPVQAKPCPLFELRGSPRERGQIHGESGRPLIQALIQEHFAFLEYSAMRLLGIAFSRAQLVNVSAQYLAACERFAPDLTDEMRGIAEASGVPFLEILSLNAFIDLADMVRPETAGNYFAFATNGCTSFGAMPPATRDGKVYLGQTFDTKAVFEPYVCALKIKEPAETIRSPGASGISTNAVVATFAGVVGCAGINSHGVGVVINHLHTLDARPGVPFTLAVRKLLQAPGVDHALETLRGLEPASGVHFLVGDQNRVLGAETSATKFELLAPTQGILSHANHCRGNRLQEVAIEPSVYSLCRGDRARELLAAQVGKIDAGVLAEIAADHVGADDTICSHAEADAPRLRQYKTDFAVILEPAHCAMNLWVGSPCEKKKERLEIGD